MLYLYLFLLIYVVYTLHFGAKGLGGVVYMQQKSLEAWRRFEVVESS